MPIKTKTTVAFEDSTETEWAIDGDWLCYNGEDLILRVDDLPEFIQFLQGEAERLELEPAHRISISDKGDA